MNAKVITRGALTIALICIFFTIFKGTTNIINAILVPLALYLCLVNEKRKAIFSVFGATIVMCFLLFKVQIIFAVFYCLITFLLLIMHRNKWVKVNGILMISFASFLSFWVSITVTDHIFLTRIEEIMLNLFDRNYLVYLLVLFIESVLVSIGLVFISNRIYKRFAPLME